MTLDVLYTAWNRLEFVRVTFELLIANTDWSRVAKLYVVDDGSTDGTKKWLARRVSQLNREWEGEPWVEMHHLELRSPPAIMNHYLRGSIADAFAKIDSDVALPPDWLEAMLDVMEREPEVELLGLEAGQTEMAGRDGKPWDGVYRFEPSTHVGGVGIFQTERFRRLPPIEENGRFGWTEHQELYRWVRGWITPDLPAPQLDRIPREPWQSLAAYYVEEGWARPWPPMDDRWCAPYFDWLDPVLSEVAP